MNRMPVSSKLDMKININRSLWITLAKTNANRLNTRALCFISFEGESIEEVANFCYLDSYTTGDGCADVGVVSRTSKASYALYMLNAYYFWGFFFVQTFFVKSHHNISARLRNYYFTIKNIIYISLPFNSIGLYKNSSKSTTIIFSYLFIQNRIYNIEYLTHAWLKSILTYSRLILKLC